MTCSRIPKRGVRPCSAASFALFLALAAGDDVEQQPLSRMALERGRHLGPERGREQTRPEGHQELQPLGHLGQQRGGQPGVFAPCAGRCQCADETELLGTARDLTQIRQSRGPRTAGHRRGRAVAAPDQVSTVPIGRKEPVEGECHSLFLLWGPTATATPLPEVVHTDAPDERTGQLPHCRGECSSSRRRRWRCLSSHASSGCQRGRRCRRTPTCGSRSRKVFKAQSRHAVVADPVAMEAVGSATIHIGQMSPDEVRSREPATSGAGPDSPTVRAALPGVPCTTRETPDANGNRVGSTTTCLGRHALQIHVPTLGQQIPVHHATVATEHHGGVNARNRPSQQPEQRLA